MARYELSAEEWFFIELLFLATEPNPHLELLYKYFNECKKESLPRETLKSLQEKKILTKTYKIPAEGSELDLNALEFNKNFINYYFKESQEAGQEFFMTYPDFLQFGDKLLPARNITKGGFLSLEDFFYAYGKAIGHDPGLHEKVIEVLKWAVENQLITYGIVEYLITRKWNDHMRMRESGEIGKFAVRVQTLDDI